MAKIVSRVDLGMRRKRRALNGVHASTIEGTTQKLSRTTMPL
ncbi:MAG: hypothetical protein ACC742_16800 [Thermoanaerobaculales bacterium]